MKRMKCIITIMAGALLASSATAETIVGLATSEDLENAGIYREKTTVAGGTVIVDTEAGAFMLAYTDDWGTSSACGSYRTVAVGDSGEIELGSGAVGNTNPTFTSYQAGVMSAGAVFEITARRDGWMTVFTKLNPNKQYVVFEGKDLPMAYTLGVAGADYKINYTIPSIESGEKAGSIDFNAADASRYFMTARVKLEDGTWEELPGQNVPQFPYLVAGRDSAPGEGTGFLTFRVKGGKTYYVSALGSKMVCQGYVFTEGDEQPSVTFFAREELPEVRFEAEQSTPEVTPPSDPPVSNPSMSGKSAIVFADVEDFEKVGIEQAKTEVPGGTVILDEAGGSFTLAYDDQWGMASTYGPYRSIRIGDSDEIVLGSGAVGNTNPTFKGYGQGVMSAGAVFEMTAKKSGWMTVFTRMNPNKQYVVFEGKNDPVAYTLGLAGSDYKINYTLPCVESGERIGLLDLSDAEDSRYFITAQKQAVNEAGEPLWYDQDGNIVVGERPSWTDDYGTEQSGKAVMEDVQGEYVPQYPYLVAGMDSAPTQMGTGFMTFQVKAGKTYYVSGLGTKMSCQGFVLTETLEQPAVSFSAGEEIPAVNFETGLPTIPLKAGDEFEYGGLRYTVLDPEALTCQTKEGTALSLSAGNTHNGALTIPSTVSNESYELKVVKIGDYGFCNHTGLTSVVIPETVTSIGLDAFYMCKGLTSVSLPSTITEIGGYAFNDCSELTSISLPESLRTLPDNIFGSCTSLSSVTFPTGLTSIGDGAFSNCTALEDIVLPASLTDLGARAFAFCRNLDKVSLPAGLKTVGNLAFAESTLISEVTYLAEIPLALSANTFDETVYDDAVLKMPAATLADIEATEPWNRFKNYVAKDGSFGFVTSVGDEFEYEGLRYTVTDVNPMTCMVKEAADVAEGDLVIPSEVSDGSSGYSVTAIGRDGFRGSKYLYSVSLPSTIDSIGSGAFSECPRLTSLVWTRQDRLDADVIEDIGNPNLLLYVEEARFAPEGVAANIVAAGVCDSLVLVPGHPFTPVKQFTANRSRMEKEFTQKTLIGVCAGWQSIVLPFDVSEVYAENIDSPLTPFALFTDRYTQRPYWLYEADAAGDWTEASVIKAGVPYIISAPNNSAYPAYCNVDGKVVFSSGDPQLITPATTAPYATTWATGSEFRSLWLPLGESELADAMAINVGVANLKGEDGELLPPGSVFHEGIEPKPLEAYVTRTGSEKMMKIFGAQSGVSETFSGEGLDIRVEEGAIVIRSDRDRTVCIYAPDGIVVRSVGLKAGLKVRVSDLDSGLYMIEGRKIALF